MEWYVELYSESAGYKKLSSEERNLPANWADFAFQYLRSEKYFGVVRSVSVDSLDFVNSGKTFVDSIINTYGVTEKVQVLIWHKVSDDNFSVFYHGVLDLTTYEIGKTATKIKIIDSGFVQKFRSNEDKEVDVSRETDLDGSAIDPHTWKTATLTARGIEVFGDSKTVEIENATDNSEFIVTPTERNGNEGLIEMSEDSTYFYQSTIATEKLTVNTGGFFDVAQTGSDTVEIDIYVAHYNRGGVFQSSEKVYSTTFSSSAERIRFTGTTAIFNTVRGDKLRYYVRLTVGVVPSSATFDYFNNSVYAEVTTLQHTDPTDVEFDFPFPIFNRALWILTGGENRLRSTVLGSALDGYPSNGLAWNYGIASGYMLRDIAKYPTFKFSDLFESYSRIFNLGLGFERDGGKRVVRVEDKEYFFQRTRVITLSDIKDFTRSYAENWVENTYAVGYENQDYNEYGGQSEFNQRLDYSNKLTTKADLDLISAFRADGIGIELQRRATDTDDDADGDADNFVIDLKDDGGYTNRTAADAGITDVAGIPDPPTVYNITISPRHNLIRGGAWLRSALDKFKSEKVTFTGSDKNIGLTYTENGDSIDEDGDITINDFSRPIFEPELYQFTCPLSSAQIETIEANPHGILHFVYNIVDYYGYLVEMTIKVTEKQANFKLLKTYKFVE